MEIKPQTESVLAKLMGLEGTQHNKKLQYGRQGVLSKRYLQKNALICQRRKRAPNRFSEETMMDRKDSDAVLLCSSSSVKTPLVRYEKESVGIFQKLRLLNSTLKVEKNGHSLRRFHCPDDKECVASKKPVEKVLHQNEKIPSGVRRRDGDLKTHGFVVRHGVAKQVAIELQQSAWHDYSKKLRSVCTRDEADDFPRDINMGYIRYSHFRSVKFNVHKAEETPLFSSDLNEFGEIDVIKDCLSGPPSPTNFPERSDAGTTTYQAFEMVLDELPDMLQEIDSFRNRVCRKSNALKQQDEDDLQFNSTSNLKDVSSITHLYDDQGFKVHLQQPTKKTEDTRVRSYIADTLAELDNQPLDDVVELFAFEKLENKYGKHPSWLRSDCKLLLDCIQGRLSDIVNPPKGIKTWYKPHKCLQLNKEIIKKEVFDLVANQLKEVPRDSLEVIERDTDWVEFDEQMEVVAKEIEDDLIDKLVEEIINT